MSFESSETGFDFYLAHEVDALYDAAETSGSDNPDDPYHHPLGNYWETEGFAQHPNDSEQDTDLRADNTGPPDPPDTLPPAYGETPGDPDDFGVGRFEHYTPNPQEAIEAGVTYLRRLNSLFAKGRLQNYIDTDGSGEKALRLAVNMPQGQALITVTNEQKISVQFEGINDSMATHYYQRRDGVVRYRLDDIWSIFNEIEAPIETTDEHGIQGLLLPPAEPDQSRPQSWPDERLVGMEELAAIFELADKADPVKIPFLHLRDSVLSGFTRPLPRESDEPVWAGQEFAGYVRAGLELYGYEDGQMFEKNITNAVTGDNVSVEVGESPDPRDTTIRNPYAHVTWNHTIGRAFLDTVPAATVEEQEAIDNAHAGEETIAISYRLVNGELEAIYRRTVVTFTTPERIIIGSGRLHVRCKRSIARDLRNFFRSPIA